jgi:Ca2+-dependent lipid-binding protein
VRPETNNPIWQESFYYHFENLTVQDLDTSKIIFNVYDKNNIFLKNSHVGQIELDWTNIYFRRYLILHPDTTKSTEDGSL